MTNEEEVPRFGLRRGARFLETLREEADADGADEEWLTGLRQELGDDALSDAGEDSVPSVIDLRDVDGLADIDGVADGAGGAGGADGADLADTADQDDVVHDGGTADPQVGEVEGLEAEPGVAEEGPVEGPDSGDPAVQAADPEVAEVDDPAEPPEVADVGGLEDHPDLAHLERPLAHSDPADSDTADSDTADSHRADAEGPAGDPDVADLPTLEAEPEVAEVDNRMGQAGVADGAGASTSGGSAPGSEPQQAPAEEGLGHSPSPANGHGSGQPASPIVAGLGDAMQMLEDRLSVLEEALAKAAAACTVSRVVLGQARAASGDAPDTPDAPEAPQQEPEQGRAPDRSPGSQRGTAHEYDPLPIPLGHVGAPAPRSSPAHRLRGLPDPPVARVITAIRRQRWAERAERWVANRERRVTDRE